MRGCEGLFFKRFAVGDWNLDSVPSAKRYGNRVAQNKFPTEKLSEMIDSGIENSGKVEYDKQISLQRQKIIVQPEISKWGLPRIVTVRKLVRKKKVPN